MRPADESRNHPSRTEKYSLCNLSSLTDLAPACETSGTYELWELKMKTLPEEWSKPLVDTALSLQTDTR